jgi:hypothetical protein
VYLLCKGDAGGRYVVKPIYDGGWLPRVRSLRFAAATGVVWEHRLVDEDDPEKRIAELERQLAEAKAAAAAETGSNPAPTPAPPPPQSGPLISFGGKWVSVDGGDFHQVEGADAAMSARAQQRVVDLARQMAEAFQENLRAGDVSRDDVKARRDALNRAVIESGLSPDQVRHVYKQAAVSASMAGQGFSATGPIDTRLSEPPRRIPWAFRLAEVLPFRWWYIFALFMVGVGLGVGGIAIFAQRPRLLSILMLVALVAIYAFQFAGTAKRFALLKWGQVATVTSSHIASRATYYSGTTWGMAPLPIAHGWQVRRPFYSGPNTKTNIRYALNGVQGELTVSGREYVDGVVLADTRNPARALCVTSFAYDLDRDETGNWIGRIRPRLLLGMVVWLIVVIGWVSLATGLVTGRLFGFDFGGDGSADTSASVPKGGSLTVGPTSHVRTVACDDGSLTLSAPNGTYTVTGHCASLTLTSYNSHLTADSANTITVSGYGNMVQVGACDSCDVTVSQYGNSLEVSGHAANLVVNAYNNKVTIDSAETITVGGYSNTITYHSGEPQKKQLGYSNTIQQG